MITKPSVFDIKYEGMSKQELKLNHARDMMLYEQTVALQKLANMSVQNTVDIPNDRVVPHYVYGDDLYDIIECKVFHENTPLYIEYEELRRQRNTLLELINSLKINLLGKLFFILVLNIIAIPVCYISKPNFIQIPFITLLTILISFYLVCRKIKIIEYKSEQLRIKRDKLVKDNYKGKKRRVH